MRLLQRSPKRFVSCCLLVFVSSVLLLQPVRINVNDSIRPIIVVNGYATTSTTTTSTKRRNYNANGGGNRRTTTNTMKSNLPVALLPSSSSSSSLLSLSFSTTATRSTTTTIGTSASTRNYFCGLPTTNTNRYSPSSCCSQHFWTLPPQCRTTRLFTSSSSSTNDNDQIIITTTSDKLVSLQKQVSNSIVTTSVESSSTTNSEIVKINEMEHLQHQKQVFDGLVDFFTSEDAVPADIIPVYQHMANKIITTIVQNRHEQSANNDSSVPIVLKILDVACGTGVLWDYLVEATAAAVAAKNENGPPIRLQIIGIDLSSNMVQAASARADILFEKYLYTTKDQRPTFRVFEGDITQYTLPERVVGVDTVLEYDTKYRYDAILLNACYGNFYNPNTVMNNIVTNFMKQQTSSTVFITHPLGATFVDKLHTEDPKTVPHTLPLSSYDFIQATFGLPLELIELSTNNIQLHDRSYPFYFTAAKRVRATPLNDVLRFVGQVDTGYGRGGKKLGFPTANLPSHLFQDALLSIPNGVYFGYAIIVDDTNNSEALGRNQIHKAVVNVGISPTFVGSENPEKIIEAHLIVDDDSNDEQISDFYGEIMKLQLIGYLRPEKKFPSFPALIEQITADVKDANHLLTNVEPYVKFRQDPFLQQSTSNNDNDNDDSVPSDNNSNSSGYYEFEDLRQVLRTLYNQEQ